MSSQKKRKLSGLNSMELELAYKSLLNLKNALDAVSEDVIPLSEAQEEKNSIFDEHLKEMITLMDSRLAESKVRSIGGCPLQALTFSSMTWVVLQAQMHITASNLIVLKNDKLEERIQSTTLLGQDKLWSSETMCRHLKMLDVLVARSNEASARAWIDTFFFRAAAMVPADRRMVLNMEYTIPSMTVHPQSLATISGHADYAAIVAEPDDATSLLTNTQILQLKQLFMPFGFFVTTEGKPGDSELSGHVPQAISQIYRCAKTLQKDILRGALTNGREWIFLIIYLKDNGDGATFKQSRTLSFDENIEREANLIAGVLSYWIEHSFEDIAAEDWFEDRTR